MSVVTRRDKSGRKRHHARVHLGRGKYAYGPVRDTRDEARADEARLVLDPKRRREQTVSQLIDWHNSVYPGRPRRHGKPPRASTAATMRYTLESFRHSFGPVKPSEISREQIKDWVAKHPGQSRQVRVMFNDAIDSELLDRSPLDRIHIPSGKGRGQIVVPTLEEVLSLAECASQEHGEYGPTFSAMLLWFAYTCMRPGEVFVLEYDDIEGDVIDLQRNLGGTGEVTTPKNHRTRRIICPAPAREAIRSMPRELSSPRIFNTKRGSRFSGPTLSWYWQPVKAAFLKSLSDSRRRQLDPPDQRFVPYSLRHFGATYMLEAPPHGLGLDLADVAHQLGHTDINITRRYVHVAEERSLERLRRAMNPRPISDIRAVKE